MAADPLGDEWLYDKNHHVMRHRLAPRSLLWQFRFLLIGVLIVVSGRPGLAATPSAEVVMEYQLKAAFLFNFLKFTTWPADALPEKAPLRIAVLAAPAVQAIIADALKGKQVDTHPVEVLGFGETDDWRGSHLLFVPRDNNQSPAALRAKLDSSPVLLVGETKNFSRTGGTIGFVQRGANIRFQINLEQAQACNLKLSARLACLAEIVKSREP